jgi:hypothetical protein
MVDKALEENVLLVDLGTLGAIERRVLLKVLV